MTDEAPPAGDAAGLAGWRVVVTGDAARTSDLGRRVSERGAEVVALPVVSVGDPADGGAALRAAASRLVTGDYDWVMVTSTNGVDRLRRAIGGRSFPPSLRWAAVGPSTGRALEGAGLPCDLVPEAATADALADALVAAAPAARVLYPRAERVRSDLADHLRRASWTVDDVVAYRTTAAAPDAATRGAAQRADAVLFTSGSAVEQTVAVLGTDGVPPVVVTIGPSTSAVARTAGLRVAAEARPHSTGGLVEALVAVAGGRREGSAG
ncbi:MAG TPA: uroporphyrinogen-III synthase [Acidimicrobiales bacterium]|nr:uroporphyrinogen-III synthase [Acidimicrobiales bacterium]